ncbi:MAG: hypothetical protein JRI56_00150 [Deltaproteobacteria bacterium]|nr:hypothetical protein [Deltaproteobacteria bacterium]
MTVKELKKALEGLDDSTEVWLTVWNTNEGTLDAAKLDDAESESFGLNLVGDKTTTWRLNHE